MYLKKVNMNDSAGKKKRLIGTELKKEIIENHEQGAHVVHLPKQWKRSTLI